MYNWSTDEKRFKREDPEGYKLWRLTQLINYGLGGEKLARQELKRVWPKIREALDPYKKRALDFFCEKEEVDPSTVESFLKKYSPKLSVVRIKRSQFI